MTTKGGVKRGVKKLSWIIVIAAALIVLGLILGWWRWGMGRGGGGGGIPIGGTGQGEEREEAPETPPSPAPARCELRLDADGLTIDGKPGTIVDAVRVCLRSGEALLRVVGDAPYGVYQELRRALEQAKVKILD
jgi:hypothetical protein